MQWVSSVAVLPDGRIVSGSGDKTIRIWDAATGATILVLRGHDEVRVCVVITGHNVLSYVVKIST